MCIIGNIELSKEVLHKQINFICSEKEDYKNIKEISIYTGKNYSISFVRHLIRRGVSLR